MVRYGRRRCRYYETTICYGYDDYHLYELFLGHLQTIRLLLQMLELLSIELSGMLQMHSNVQCDIIMLLLLFLLRVHVRLYCYVEPVLRLRSRLRQKRRS